MGSWGAMAQLVSCFTQTFSLKLMSADCPNSTSLVLAYLPMARPLTYNKHAATQWVQLF